jgi:hypothetical protein
LLLLLLFLIFLLVVLATEPFEDEVNEDPLRDEGKLGERSEVYVAVLHDEAEEARDTLDQM